MNTQIQTRKHKHTKTIYKHSHFLQFEDRETLDGLLDSLFNSFDCDQSGTNITDTGNHWVGLETSSLQTDHCSVCLCASQQNPTGHCGQTQPTSSYPNSHFFRFSQVSSRLPPYSVTHVLFCMLIS